MQQDFNPPDDDITRDPDVIAAETCLEHFGKRGITMIDALQSVKSFIVTLDFIPSVVRYITRESYGQISVRRLFSENTQTRLRNRKTRAQEVVRELKAIYSRLHWGQLQRGRTDWRDKRRWEDIVAIASDQASNSQLVDYLLEYIDANDQGADFKIPNGVPMRFVDPLSR